MSTSEERSVTLKSRQWEYLQRMMQTYNLPDEAKAIRCLIDFAIEGTEHESSMFKESRCFDC